MDYRDLGARVKACRIRKHLTQEQMAELLGLSVSMIGHMERGTRAVSVNTLTGVCKLLGVSMGYLLENSLTIPNGQMHKNNFLN